MHLHLIFIFVILATVIVNSSLAENTPTPTSEPSTFLTTSKPSISPSLFVSTYNPTSTTSPTSVPSLTVDSSSPTAESTFVPSLDLTNSTVPSTMPVTQPETRPGTSSLQIVFYTFAAIGITAALLLVVHVSLRSRFNTCCTCSYDHHLLCSLCMSIERLPLSTRKKSRCLCLVPAIIYSRSPWLFSI